MTAKKITEISESLEKLGYEIIKIKEIKADEVFSAEMRIVITPIKTTAAKAKNAKMPDDNSQKKTFLQAFKDTVNKTKRKPEKK